MAVSEDLFPETKFLQVFVQGIIDEVYFINLCGQVCLFGSPLLILFPHAPDVILRIHIKRASL